MEAFEYLKVNIHDSEYTRKYLVESQKAIQNTIDSIEDLIRQEKELKRYLLANMMV